MWLRSGWWLVENEDKKMAWFPAPYLEKLDEDEDGIDGIPERGTCLDTVSINTHCIVFFFNQHLITN